MNTGHSSRRHAGFTVIDAMVVALVLTVLIAVLLPALGASRRTARSMSNNSQVRGIHQGLVNFAQTNKTGGNDGYFPGLDATGNVVPNGPLTGYSGDGTQPAARLWMMLDVNFFTPEYMVSPADTHAVELAVVSGTVPPVVHTHFSYALQSIAGHPDERGEWSETLNTAAIILGDRAIGTDTADISSVWTAPGSGDWRGGVASNDNSTSFETDPVITDTQYGTQPVNATDHLFTDDPATADAFLVHDDATTAYSKD